MRRIIVFLLILLTGIFVYTSSAIDGIKPVTATYMQKTGYTEKIYVSGEFESTSSTEIRLSYPVYIKDIYVKENDSVIQGQALFSLDTDKMQSVLMGENISAAAEMLNYSDMMTAADFNTVSALNIESTIYAPTDGVITDISVYKGGFAVKNTTLVSIAESGDLAARFTLSQSDFGRVEVGDTVLISPVVFPDIEYRGKITDRSAVVRKQLSVTGTNVIIDVFADISNPDKRISDGLQIKGEIICGEPQVKNMLDYSYISQDEGGEFVYIYDSGKAVKKYITTGTETETQAEILDYFDDNTVFISGEITDGDKVIIMGGTDEFI